ncbi:MAG: hypothetical protein FWF25_03065 [Propionibacteriaceae bacterium]|nr:hypothetical protein [Propionibacteriaceae bacterium]
MAAKKIRFWRNPWTIGVGSILIASIITSGFKAVVSQVSPLAALKWFGHGIVAILMFGIPIYVVLLVVLLVIIALDVATRPLQTPVAVSQPDYLSYTTTTYKRWTLRWGYRERLDPRRYEIRDVRPVCSCDCELGPYHSLPIPALECPRCGKRYPVFSPEDADNAAKVIEHDIRHETYKTRPETLKGLVA